MSSLLVSDPKVSLEEPFVQPGHLLPFPNKRRFTSHHERSPGTEGKKNPVGKSIQEQGWKQPEPELGRKGLVFSQVRLPTHPWLLGLAPWGEIPKFPSSCGKAEVLWELFKGRARLGEKQIYRTGMHQHSCGEVVPPQWSGGLQWLGSNVQFSAFSTFPAKRVSFCAHNPLRRINTFLLTHS